METLLAEKLVFSPPLTDKDQKTQRATEKKNGARTNSMDSH